MIGGVIIEEHTLLKNMQEAIISLLHSKKIKHPENVIHIKSNIFSYTNSRGVTHTYYVFLTNLAYKKFASNTPHKLYKSKTFYIVELI